MRAQQALILEWLDIGSRKDSGKIKVFREKWSAAVEGAENYSASVRYGWITSTPARGRTFGMSAEGGADTVGVVA